MPLKRTAVFLSSPIPRVNQRAEGARMWVSDRLRRKTWGASIRSRPSRDSKKKSFLANRPPPSDEHALLALLERWRGEAVRSGYAITRIVVAYEAGRDGFWLARWLRGRASRRM